MSVTLDKGVYSIRCGKCKMNLVGVIKHKAIDAVLPRFSENGGTIKDEERPQPLKCKS